jgi:hypothetical protein
VCSMCAPGRRSGAIQDQGGRLAASRQRTAYSTSDLLEAQPARRPPPHWRQRARRAQHVEENGYSLMPMCGYLILALVESRWVHSVAASGRHKAPTLVTNRRHQFQQQRLNHPLLPR